MFPCKFEAGRKSALRDNTDLDRVLFLFFTPGMDKESFLRLQYLRMINSDEFVVEVWRSSCDRFLRDMWERTPSQPGRRFLAPVDATLGFSLDNVEWQFPRIKSKSSIAIRPATAIPTKPTVIRATKAERKAIKLAEAAGAREAKRHSIAGELAAWNDGQLAVKRG